MKIFILSPEGLSLDLAIRLQNEDNEVIFSIQDKKVDDIGRGIVKTTHSLDGMMSSDLIITDDAMKGRVVDKLRKLGKKVIGGSSITDKLENDREFGQDVAKGCGVLVPKTTKFTSFEKAIDFVKETNKKYVFKPHGQKERTLTYISENAEDMILTMKHFKKIWPGDVVFELQEFVKGVEMAIGGWFDGEKFLKPVLPNFEFKKLADGDLGPNTGEMGTVVCYRTHSPLFEATLKKTESFLRTAGYVGYLDMNCICTNHGAYMLEWTSRFGSPTLQIQDELNMGKWSTFFYNLASQKADRVIANTDKWAVGVVMASLPFPLQLPKEIYKDKPLFFLKEMDHVHLLDVWKDPDGCYRQGGFGCICVVTGSDHDLSKAKEKAYEIIKKIHISGGFYRLDIADRVIKEDLPQLKSWGWIK